MNINLADVVIIIVLIIAIIAALIVIKRNKGKCAYCAHYETCPFKKVIKNRKRGSELLDSKPMPKLGNHVYFYDNGQLVMRIIPKGMTPQETIDEYKRNRCKDIN